MSDIAKLSAAMAAAFPDIEGALKDSTNPHFKSKYADLSSVVAAIKPALIKQGLWFRQVLHPHDHGVSVETVIHHASGEYLSCGVLFVPASKHDAQGFGSATTYCRRYSLQAAFGVCPEDDDGNAAAKAPPKPVQTVSEARQRVVRSTADACIAAHAKDDAWACYEAASGITDPEERVMLWDMLKEHSKVRSTIKQMAEAEKAGERKAA